MNKPIMNADRVATLIESKYLNMFQLQYDAVNYNIATRRKKDNIMALKSEDEAKVALPDAVTCFVILTSKSDEPKLLMQYEYRYPIGEFLLSPPAGLMDIEDQAEECPQITTAIREIKEETGILVKETDRVFVLNPLAYSTPGMTDESNALVVAVIDLDEQGGMTNEGCEGTELFNGFMLLTKEEALQLLKQGRDEQGMFYSMYAFGALLYFVSDLWK